MIGLLVIGYVAGLIAGVSPCILPILPVVLVGWSTPIEEDAGGRTMRRRRSVSVVLGLVLSFGIITALGSVILSNLGLPEGLLHNLGILMLLLFGLGLMVPKLERWLERPFQRLARGTPSGASAGFVLGLGLGLVFVPCAGPVLAAISVLGTSHHASFFGVLLSICFAAGAATPLLVIALAGDRLLERNRSMAQRSRQWRPIAGAILIVMALAVNFNVTASLQRALPGYTQTLQKWVEGNSFTTEHLRSLQNQQNVGSLVDCENRAASGVMRSLGNCGLAPDFSKPTTWLNTPKNQPLTLKNLKGKVVLIDFWTYSCINCQRTLPHLEAWYQRYRDSGLVIVGVESPEFAFEHSPSNIAAAARSLGVNYPIAIDDNLSTWNAYANQYWPAEYLVDAEGVIRHVSYGEGNYAANELHLRTLLKAASPGIHLPAPTSVMDLTPVQQLSPETYLGMERSLYLVNGVMTTGVQSTYHLPTSVAPGFYALGGAWTATAQSIHAGPNAALELNFHAKDVYLVLGGTGTVTQALDGVPLPTIHVRGFPTLYKLVSLPSTSSGLLDLHFNGSVAAYDFTFG